MHCGLYRGADNGNDYSDQRGRYDKVGSCGADVESGCGHDFTDDGDFGSVAIAAVHLRCNGFQQYGCHVECQPQGRGDNHGRWALRFAFHGSDSDDRDDHGDQRRGHNQDGGRDRDDQSGGSSDGDSADRDAKCVADRAVYSSGDGVDQYSSDVGKQSCRSGSNFVGGAVYGALHGYGADDRDDHGDQRRGHDQVRGGNGNAESGVDLLDADDSFFDGVSDAAIYSGSNGIDQYGGDLDDHSGRNRDDHVGGSLNRANGHRVGANGYRDGDCCRGSHAVR